MRRARVPLQARFYIIFPIGYVLLFPLCSLMTIERDWRCFLACIRNRYNDVGKGRPVEWGNGDKELTIIQSWALSCPYLPYLRSIVIYFFFTKPRLKVGVVRWPKADALVVFRIHLCRFTCSYMRLIIVGHHHDSMKSHVSLCLFDMC